LPSWCGLHLAETLVLDAQRLDVVIDEVQQRSADELAEVLDLASRSAAFAFQVAVESECV